MFEFRPECLVRMSTDDIINQYDIFPIVIVLLNRKLVKVMMQLFTRPSKKQLTEIGGPLKRSIVGMWKNNSIYSQKYKFLKNSTTLVSSKYSKSLTMNSMCLSSLSNFSSKLDCVKETPCYRSWGKRISFTNQRQKPFLRKLSKS